MRSTNVLPRNSYSSYEINRRVDALVSGQFARNCYSNNNSSEYAKTAFYQSLCNNGYSGYSGSLSSHSSSSTGGAWCSNGIF